MSKVRRVEYYRLWENCTWDTDFIDIPADTPEDKLGKAITEAAQKMYWEFDVPVIVGLYCSNDEDKISDE